MKNDLFENHDEIVCVLYEGRIITNHDMIAKFIKNKYKFQPISRAMCRIANRLDLGDKWEKLSQLPIVFRLDWGEYLRGLNES